jgi:hypothetical protein
MRRRPVADSLQILMADASLRLPRRIGVSTAAAEMIAALRTGTGVTFNLHFGEIRGQNLYAVSIYPERSVFLPIEGLTPSLVEDFIRANRDLLSDPRNCVGIWYVREEGTLYLDVSTTLPSLETAVRLGQEYNQIGIYDFQNGRVIDTGGTGTEVPDLLPVEGRLPPLERKAHNEDDTGHSGDDDT